MSRSSAARHRMPYAVGPSKASPVRADACPACGETSLVLLYRVDGVPAQSCVSVSSAKAARRFPRGSIELSQCTECGFLTNIRFDAALVDYGLEYEDSQSFSTTFGAFAESLAAKLIERYGVRGKRVVEIGCGKGDFLALLCSRGGNDGVGIDPAADPRRLPDEVADRIRIVPEPFGLHHEGLIGDFICCRHTLEHIPHVYEFLALLRKAIGERQDTVVFVEVPEAMRILRDGAFWDIYHEHCSYFTSGSLARLFDRAGFEILNVETAYEGQYLLLEARPQRKQWKALTSGLDDRNAIRAAAGQFPTVVEYQKSRWRRFLRRQVAGGIAVWGGGSKAVAFLTTLGVEDEVTCIVDINPHKQGRFAPGSGHLIVGPGALRRYDPGSLIVMNPAYRGEIRATVTDLGMNPQLVALGDPI